MLIESALERLRLKGCRLGPTLLPLRVSYQIIDAVNH